MKKIILMVLAGLLFQACASRKFTGVDAWKNDAFLSDSLLAGIDRHPCFGACPNYSARIYKSGFVRYEGIKDVPFVGLRTGYLSPIRINELVQVIRETNIEQADSLIENKYLADFPGLDLYVSHRKPTRHIHVMHQAPPATITVFANFLDQILASPEIQWQQHNLD